MSARRLGKLNLLLDSTPILMGGRGGLTFDKLWSEDVVKLRKSNPTCWTPGLRQAWAGTSCQGCAPRCPSRTYYAGTSLWLVPHFLRYLTFLHRYLTSLCASQVPVAMQCHHAPCLRLGSYSPNDSHVCLQIVDSRVALNEEQTYDCLNHSVSVLSQ